MLPSAVLRGVLRLKDEPEDALAENLTALRREIEPDGADRLVLGFVYDLFDRSHQVPTFSLVLQNFKRLEKQGDGNAAAAVARLDTVANPPQPLPFLVGADFIHLLDLYRKEVLREATSRLVMEASTILTSGLERRVKRGGKWEKVTLTGPEAALDYILDEVHSLNVLTRRVSMEGDFRSEGERARQQYQKWRDNPDERVGVKVGLDKIDDVHHGLKRGELALVMGFVGHMKTSFILNWAYKGAVWQGRNVGFVSLETPPEILRMLLYVMHSSHRKFESWGFASLDATKVMAGALSKDEEDFYHAVIDDFCTCPDYGAIYYTGPLDTVTIPDIKRWAESKHRNTPLDLLAIDYLGLVDVSREQSSLQQASNLNMVIRSAKRDLAESFDNGRGIAVVSPFQAGREGLKDAEKNGGRYKITALSTANEAERSSDLIYYVYLDDALRNARELIVGNLKNRNGPVLKDQFKVFADPSSRIIENLDIGGSPRQMLVDMNKTEVPKGYEAGA